MATRNDRQRFLTLAFFLRVQSIIPIPARPHSKFLPLLAPNGTMLMSAPSESPGYDYHIHQGSGGRTPNLRQQGHTYA